MVTWRLITGRAHLLKSPGSSPSLWPVSPDRISPILSKENDMLITGYAEMGADGTQSTKERYRAEQIISFIAADPSNPAEGFGPLEAACRVVDTEVEQTSWNKAAMQNRGVLDGFLSFKEALEPEQIDAIEETLETKWTGSKNARRIGVIGSEASYVRIGSTPAEMDFTESRKALRDEMLAAFGVPSQLANAQESATYNNFQVANLMLWQMTVIPILVSMADQYTHEFDADAGEPLNKSLHLKDGEMIEADLSKVSALQADMTERADAAEKLSRAGYPRNQVNKVLGLGFEEFEGWETPYIATTAAQAAAPVPTQAPAPESDDKPEPPKRAYELRAYRDHEAEATARENLAAKLATDELAPILEAQGDAILKAVADNATQLTLQTIIISYRAQMREALKTIYVTAATSGADNVTVKTRASDEVEQAILDALAAEGIILREMALIEASTIRQILEQVLNGRETEQTINQIQQAITDLGTFSPDRALRIARTTVGSAQSFGQLEAARAAGATVKVWATSLTNARDLHSTRDNEEAPIDGRFTQHPGNNGVSPRFPLDPDLGPEDRINCRCALTFRID